MTHKTEFALGREEDIVGKGGHAVYQHFLPYPQGFQKGYLLRVVGNEIVR